MATSSSRPSTTTQQQDPGTEQLRIRKAFWLSVIGLTLAASLVFLLVLSDWKTASDITAVAGLFTSVLGTLVGAFFGLQIGSSAKESAENRADTAQRNLNSLLAAAGPDTIEEAKKHGFNLS
jgi:hypothetical protein